MEGNNINPTIIPKENGIIKSEKIFNMPSTVCVMNDGDDIYCSAEMYSLNAIDKSNS